MVFQGYEWVEMSDTSSSLRMSLVPPKSIETYHVS
jgi:hypothetical protein